MTKNVHPSLALVALFGLAACAQGGAAGGAAAPGAGALTQGGGLTRAAAPLLAGALAPAAAGTRYDGTYVGRPGLPQQEGGGGNACPQATSDHTIRVANGVLRLGIMYRRFDGPVAADGSVNLQGPATQSNGAPGTLTGQFANNTFTGSFTYRYGTRANCTYALDGFAKRG